MARFIAVYNYSSISVTSLLSYILSDNYSKSQNVLLIDFDNYNNNLNSYINLKDPHNLGIYDLIEHCKDKLKNSITSDLDAYLRLTIPYYVNKKNPFHFIKTEKQKDYNSSLLKTHILEEELVLWNTILSTLKTILNEMYDIVIIRLGIGLSVNVAKVSTIFSDVFLHTITDNNCLTIMENINHYLYEHNKNVNIIPIVLYKNYNWMWLETVYSKYIDFYDYTYKWKKQYTTDFLKLMTVNIDNLSKVGNIICNRIT